MKLRPYLLEAGIPSVVASTFRRFALMFLSASWHRARRKLSETDLRIVRRASELLACHSRWNRVDTRTCSQNSNTISLYCALQLASLEVSGRFEHRGAAMQEARLLVDCVAPNRIRYVHRLLDYNNDPETTFADLQRFFLLLEERIAAHLSKAPSAGIATDSKSTGFRN
jgi:hypothetical protein